MEIVSSRVSVYEIELNLEQWEYKASNEVPGFYEVLTQSIPSVQNHKCLTGEVGGFLQEVRKGTSFAHIIEHVLLELIHLADLEKQVYSGWTREKGGASYIIHYGAPDFLTGRLAAKLGVEIVKQLIEGIAINQQHYIALLRDPLRYYTREKKLVNEQRKFDEPLSYIQELETLSNSAPVDGLQSLENDRLENVRDILVLVQRHLDYIVELWKRTFFEYSGNFGHAIVDKVALINIDKFIHLLIEGDFQSFFRGVKNISYVLESYRIPIHFVIHSIWLYKNSLLQFINEEYAKKDQVLHDAVSDIEQFYALILQEVSRGYSAPKEESREDHIVELKEFRELRNRQELILVVDDDEMTRRAFRDILEYHGYKCLIAEDGEEAIEIVSRHKSEISLVVLDLMLPGLSGIDVYGRVKDICPELNILVSSGYPLNEITRAKFTQRSVEFISKPFKLEEFLDKVQKLIVKGVS